MKLLKMLKQEKNKKRGRMVVLHRRQITAVSLMILIGVAGYLNWNFQRDAVDPEVASVYQEVTKKLGEAKMVSTEQVETPVSVPPSENQTDDYFAQAKLERELNRSESIEMLTNILNAQNTDKESRSEAENEIHMLADFTEKETMIENLIRAKGFSETVVFMGENLISIAVKSDGLNEIDAAVITDAAISTTDYPAEKIKIVEIK